MDEEDKENQELEAITVTVKELRENNSKLGKALKAKIVPKATKHERDKNNVIKKNV